MTDLVEFLRARLDEDETAAKAAAAAIDPDDLPGDRWIYDGTVGQIRDEYQRIVLTESGYGGTFLDQKRGEHIARHDPARVLREVEAKRRIISEYERYVAERRRAMGGWDTSEPSPIITALAIVYANHPDYREEWRP